MRRPWGGVFRQRLSTIRHYDRLIGVDQQLCQFHSVLLHVNTVSGHFLPSRFALSGTQIECIIRSVLDLGNIKPSSNFLDSIFTFAH